MMFITKSNDNEKIGQTVCKCAKLWAFGARVCKAHRRTHLRRAHAELSAAVALAVALAVAEAHIDVVRMCA